SADAPSSCQQNGFCDGAGACQLYVVGVACGAPVCQGTILTGQSCNGFGTCTLVAGGTDCAPYACQSGACASPCPASANCAPGFVCSMGQCISPLANGSACSSGGMCASSFCVDGVCCDVACSGTCQACTAAKTGGADGTCASVTDGTNPNGA